jgi:hypothetical protein
MLSNSSLIILPFYTGFGYWQCCKITQDNVQYVNITRGRARVNTVSVEKHYVCINVPSSLSYAACKARAPYYIGICGLSNYTEFFYIISLTGRFSGMGGGGGFILNKTGFDFSYNIFY